MMRKLFFSQWSRGVEGGVAKEVVANGVVIMDATKKGVFTKNISQLVILSLLAIFVQGSVAARTLDPIGSEEMKRRVHELQEMPWAGPVSEQDTGTYGECKQKKVVLSVGAADSGQAVPVPFTLIQPESDQPVPLVIIIPTIEGVSQIENHMAEQFCGMGFATILADVNDPEMPKNLPAWNYEDETTRHAVLSVRTAIDYATSQPAFDKKKIGLIGSSLGGIQAAFLAELEANRLAGTMIVVGGGNLPSIMARSDNELVADLRNARMDHDHITSVDVYEEKLRETVRFDSMYFAPLAKTNKIFMVMSNNDVKVPSEDQVELFQALGQPSSTTFSVSHVETIFSLTFFYFDYVSDFFKKSFGLKADLGTRVHLLIPPPTQSERNTDVFEAAF